MKKQRNWLLIVLVIVGTTGFVLSRTVWGPPSRAVAAEVSTHAHVSNPESDEMSDAQRRYLTNQPRHWRYVMLKRN